MMMLKITLRELQRGGTLEFLLIFGSPKPIPISKHAIQILYMGKHFPFSRNSKAWGNPKLQG
jgi:hypothetical protein